MFSITGKTIELGLMCSVICTVTLHLSIYTMRHFRRSLNFKQKLKIINLVSKGVKKGLIAKRFRLANSSVSTIIKRKNSILASIDNLPNLNVTKHRNAKNVNIERAVIYFITKARNANIHTIEWCDCSG